MKCMRCNAENIEKDDNFCWKCGHWTAKGFNFLKERKNVDIVLNGSAAKQNNRFGVLLGLLGFGIILFVTIYIVRGDDLFKPVIYLNKEISNYVHGYRTSTMKTDNKYKEVTINNYESAIEFIEKDFSMQNWLCGNSDEVSRLEYNLKTTYEIPSVSFCDLNYDEALKINNVIEEMYTLFPSLKGSLTNITIANADENNDYIAYFQPLYQFVNIDADINLYNKVNKTQILLNSYYFLNETMTSKNLSTVVGDNWYVDDATWESTIAHELGHALSFKLLLQENGLDNITFVTPDNELQIESILNLVNSGDFSYNLLTESLNNYNQKYGTSLNIDEFAKSISEYASVKDENDRIIADETIAEAIHDYYLHRESMKNTSAEIIETISAKFQ